MEGGRRGNVGGAGQGPKHPPPLPSMCETDRATPLLMRCHGPSYEEPLSPPGLERQLFADSDSEGTDEDTVTEDTDSMSGVSTIDSPCSDRLSDPVADLGSEELEFRTDVSCTRKRRK